MTTRVLIVCLANTCRSPAGADVLRHLSTLSAFKKGPLEVDSAAVTSWSIGEPPNPQMTEILQARGIAVTPGRVARRIQPHDLEAFDYILAVTQDVLDQLRRLSSVPEHQKKMRLLGEFGVAYAGQDIPDPYAQENSTCELVVDMLEDTCQGFLIHLRDSGSAPPSR